MRVDQRQRTSGMKVGWRWIVLMAWRDSRRNRLKLLLFALSVTFGIAALVAINSFSASMEDEMDRKAMELLGADLRIRGNNPFDEETRQLIDGLKADESATEVEFRTMTYFPRVEGSRLAQIRGFEGEYPWYGDLDTYPAGLHVSNASEPVAIVEESLRAQFDLQVGDDIRIGKQAFRIIGEFRKMPGESMIRGTFIPRILIPMRYVEATDLLQSKSRVRYLEYLKFSDGLKETNLATLKNNRRNLRAKNIRYTTVEDQRNNLGNALKRMNSFLNMIGFVALLLGSVGIACGVQAYLKSKVKSVALLRCVGASAFQSVAIFCVQIVVVGSLGVAIGAIFGVFAQGLATRVAAPFLPLDAPSHISWKSMWEGILFGWLLTVLYSALPLLPLRKVTPLRAIRSLANNRSAAVRDKSVWVLSTMIGAVILIFAMTQTHNAMEGLVFVAGLFVVIGVLASVAVALRYLLRKASTRAFPFSFRQGLANLHRPNNRTLLLVIMLGMGAFMILTLRLSERALLAQMKTDDNGERTNIILFDVQPDQKEGITQRISELKMSLKLSAPIVTMRLSSINGRPVEELREIRGEKVSEWALFREYHSTYRDHLQEDEKLVEGEFIEHASLDNPNPVPISVHVDMVEALRLKLGDKLTWNVQGLSMDTSIRSIREAKWTLFKPSFFVVFPTGVLEPAPTMHILAARADDPDIRGLLQRDVVKSYPNVSLLDLTTTLLAIKEILDRVSSVVRFMAAFTILTSIVVLISTLLLSRYQRKRESALLRTLGATSKQVRGIMSVEYFMLGVLASLAGGVLAIGATWGVTTFLLEINFVFSWQVSILTLISVSSLTLITGLLNSVGIAHHPPLEVLRRES